MRNPGDPRLRFGALSSEDVAALDRAAAECGVGVLQLMEVAGWQVARFVWRQTGSSPSDLLVVAGRGHNGGDGLVAARHLATWGCRVRGFLLADPARVEGVVGANVDAARACGVELTISSDTGGLGLLLQDARHVIDALLGTGAGGDPREPQASAIQALNRSGATVLSVDVPSGLDATSGRVPAACVRARATCTLTAMKAGLWQAAARAAAGEVTLAPIAMPASAWARAGLEPPSAARGGGLTPVPSLTPP
jgi:NAD(P)H-hydrate epimerase